MYYSERCFFKKKKKKNWSGNALTQDWQIQVLPSFPTYTQTPENDYDTLHSKPRCIFKILLNTVLLVSISNTAKWEHKMNPICQCCLRPEKKFNSNGGNFTYLYF